MEDVVKPPSLAALFISWVNFAACGWALSCGNITPFRLKRTCRFTNNSLFNPSNGWQYNSAVIVSPSLIVHGPTKRTIALSSKLGLFQVNCTPSHKFLHPPASAKSCMKQALEDQGTTICTGRQNKSLDNALIGTVKRRTYSLQEIQHSTQRSRPLKTRNDCLPKTRETQICVIHRQLSEPKITTGDFEHQRNLCNFFFFRLCSMERKNKKIGFIYFLYFLCARDGQLQSCVFTRAPRNNGNVSASPYEWLTNPIPRCPCYSMRINEYDLLVL